MHSIHKNIVLRTYTFNELQLLWKQGRFTVDEMSILLQRALASFRERAMRLDYKLLALTSADEVDYLEDEYVDAETVQLIDELLHDRKAAHRAINHVLQQFSMLELRLYQMERNFAEIEMELETVPFFFN